MKISITAFPICDFITINRFHLHIHGDQIITGMGSVSCTFFQKKFSVVTFPHKTSVEIRKDHQYRVDFFTFDQFLEFLKAEHPFNILFHLIASNV